MDVTIIMPLHNPDKDLLGKIDNVVKEQDYEGKVRVVKVDEGFGLAESLNYGVQKAKTEIVVSLHQDCVPGSKDWLRKLVRPLIEDNGVVTSVSKVELPYGFWKSFDLGGKIMSAKEQGVIVPLMDEKGCAYKKSSLLKAGLFDSKNFKTAGEDFDMYIKLKKIGKIAYPDCKIFHFHKHNFQNRLKKELQLSNGFGALVRIHGKQMPDWKIGLLKSIPLFGWPLFLFKFPYARIGLAGLLWIPLSLGINLIYSFGFWKGFLEGREGI